MPTSSSSPTVMPTTSSTQIAMLTSSSTLNIVEQSNYTPSIVLSTRSPDSMESVGMSFSSSLEVSNDSIPPSFELSYDDDISFTSSPQSVEPSFTSTAVQQLVSPAIVPPVAIIEEVTLSSENKVSGGLLRPELIRQLCINSCSRKHFAAMLVEVTFDN